jgi:hypothetical protein
MMQQGKVMVGGLTFIASAVSLIGVDGVLQGVDEGRETPLLLKPAGKEMDADPGEVRRDLHESCAGCLLDRARSWTTRAAFGSMALPLAAPSVEMAHADLHTELLLGEVIEQHATWAKRVLVEALPKHREGHDAEFSARFK